MGMGICVHTFVKEAGICIRMMAPFYYQDQNAVSGLYCQVNFFNCLFISKREDKFEEESILPKHSGLGSKITPSCK